MTYTNSGSMDRDRSCCITIDNTVSLKYIQGMINQSNSYLQSGISDPLNGGYQEKKYI